MDPVSAVVATVSVAIRATELVIRFAKDTHHATEEKRRLCEEAQILLELLKRLDKRVANQDGDPDWLANHQSIIKQFEDAYQDLASLLKLDVATGQPLKESRLQSIKNRAHWSFTKADIFALLARITRLQHHADMLIADDQYTLLERIDQKQNEAETEKLKADVLNWLSPVAMTHVHQSVSDRAEPESGAWFLTSDAIKTWRQNAPQSLWCWGIPGAGKTVLASVLINHLRRERDESQKHAVGIAVFYFRYNDQEQTLGKVLGSLVGQLLQDCSTIPQSIIDLYQHNKERKMAPCAEEMQVALKKVLETFSHVHFVIDALDECNEELRWDLMDTLGQSQPKLHLLFTSRYTDNIAEDMENFQRFEIKAHRSDIELFIDRQIKKNRNLRKAVEKYKSLRQDIKDGVVKTAENMFLLARLHTEALASASALSVRHVRNKLKALPTTLEATYNDAMVRIEHQEEDHKRVALKALAWISYAMRPLTIKELQHALAIEPRHTRLDEEDLISGNSITSLCAGLVVIDQGSNQVNLVHYSTRAYFEEIRAQKFPNFHETITMSCAAYLNLEPLVDASIWDMVQEYPLSYYAAQYMGDHARKCPEESLEPSTLDSICDLLSHPNKRKPLLALLDGLDLINTGFYSSKINRASGEDDDDDDDEDDEAEKLAKAVSHGEGDRDLQKAVAASDEESWSIVSQQAGDASVSEWDESTEHGEQGSIFSGGTNLFERKIKASRVPEVTALHLAASMGLARIASMLLKQSSNIDALDETGKTALTVAMERGFEKAVEFLVASGASAGISDAHGRSILLLVTERDWDRVGNIIIDKAVLRLDASNAMSVQLKLLLGAYKNSLDDVRSLLQGPLADAQLRNKDIDNTSLWLAVERGFVEMAELLCSAGIDVDSKDNSGQSSLHRATRRANIPMMKALLGAGAQVDIKDDKGVTPWAANVTSCDDRLLNVLVQAGADPCTKTIQGVNPLYTAAQAGDVRVVTYMLEHGTDPSIQTDYGWAPLHWAAAHGYMDCVKLLHSSGAEMSPVSDQLVTPMDLANQSGETAIVKFLEAHGGRRYAELGTDLSDLRFEDKVQLSDDDMADESLGKVTISIDKPIGRTLKDPSLLGQFIHWPRKRQSVEYVYEISDVLETSRQSMYIKRASPSETMHDIRAMWHGVAAGSREVPSDYFTSSEHLLYEMSLVRPDYQEFELQGQQPDVTEKRVILQKDWTGGWKVYACAEKDDQSRVALLKTTPEWSKSREEECRWKTDDGILVARSGANDLTPWLIFEETSDRKQQDLLVACWTAKLWAEVAGEFRRRRHSSNVQPGDISF